MVRHGPPVKVMCRADQGQCYRQDQRVVLSYKPEQKNTMATLAHPIAPSFSIKNNWLSTYTTFINKAEFVRVGWAATALTIQGCVLTPALLMSMFYLGGGDWQFLVANLCFLIVLIPILAAMPVKYIMPAFVFSSVVHLAIIALNIL